MTRTFIQDLQRTLSDFAGWQNADQVVIQHAPEALQAAWGSSWRTQA